jgi:hypothetical protein
MTTEILKYAEEAKALGIYNYKSTPEEDFMLYLWWMEMRESGELDEIFSTNCQSLGNFYPLFKAPNWMFYKADDQGPQLILWASQLLSAVCMGIWVAPRSRIDPKVYRAIQIIYHALFQVYPVNVGITKREKLLTTFESLGYNIVGKIPGLLDGEVDWIVHLSKESFENSKLNPDKVDPRWKVG